MAALLFAPSAAFAFECTPVEGEVYASIRWAERDIEYAIAAPGSRTLAPLTAQSLIERAFSTWIEPDCTDLNIVSLGVVAEGADPSEVSTVVFIDRDWPHAAAAVGLTTMTYRVNDGIISYGTLELNESLFRFADAEADCAEDGVTYDLGAVVTHEAGHFFGLAHTEVDLGAGEREPTMSPVIATCDARFRTLEDDDVSGLCFIYPRGAATRQCPDLPVQPEPYVENRAFGCSTSGKPVGGLGIAIVFLLAAGQLRRMRLSV